MTSSTNFPGPVKVQGRDVATFLRNEDGSISALVDGAGNNYTLSQDRTSTVMPVEKVSLTASGSPCGAPCLLHRIRCLVGTAVSLVVYDNPFGTSGTQLYSGTLSAGEEAVIPTPVRAINGPRGVFTGTATFEYHVSQEA